jgi:hypothetical protein
VCKGPRDPNVIFLFLRDLCVNVLVEQLSFVSFRKVPVCVLVFVRIFRFNTTTCMLV